MPSVFTTLTERDPGLNKMAEVKSNNLPAERERGIYVKRGAKLKKEHLKFQADWLSNSLISSQTTPNELFNNNPQCDFEVSPW